MHHITIEEYVRLLDHLSVEEKIELLMRLTKSIKNSFALSKPDKIKILEKIAGSWKDMDDAIIEDIRKARSFSNREINLD